MALELEPGTTIDLACAMCTIIFHHLDLRVHLNTCIEVEYEILAGGKRKHTEKQVLLQQRLQCFVQLKSWQIIEI